MKATSPAPQTAVVNNAASLKGVNSSASVGWLIALILSAGCGALPDAEAETLNSALSRTYENNPSIRAAVASVQATAEAYPQARSAYLPSIQIEGQSEGYETDSKTTTRQANTRLQQVTTSTGSNSILIANLSQTLYDGGQANAGMKIAESQTASALAQLDGTIAGLFQSLTSTYVSLQSTTALLALNDDITKQLKQLEGEAQSLFSKRLGTVTDVAQAQTALASAAARRTSLIAALEKTRSDYKALSGLVPDAPSGWPTLPTLPDNLDDARRIALERNPSLRAARFGVAGARAGISAAKSGFLPNAQLGVQWYTEVNPTNNDVTGNRQYDQSVDTNGFMVTATVTVPIFNGGATRSQVRQAYEQFNATSFNMHDSYNLLISQLDAGWAQLQMAQERERLVAIQVTAAEQTLKGFTRQFQNGLSTLKDVLDSRSSLESAQAQAITVRADILNIQANLLAIIGRCTPQDFGLTVKSHGAEAYVQKLRQSILGPSLP